MTQHRDSACLLKRTARHKGPDRRHRRLRGRRVGPRRSSPAVGVVGPWPHPERRAVGAVQLPLDEIVFEDMLRYRAALSGKANIETTELVEQFNMLPVNAAQRMARFLKVRQSAA